MKVLEFVGTSMPHIRCQNENFTLASMSVDVKCISCQPAQIFGLKASLYSNGLEGTLSCARPS